MASAGVRVRILAVRLGAYLFTIHGFKELADEDVAAVAGCVRGGAEFADRVGGAGAG